MSEIIKHTVILGGGFSGLGMALELRRAGFRDFVLLEKARQLGGTWRENTYPGCACDVPSQLYSYSRWPRADWSRVFAGQSEIQDYLLDVAERSGAQEHVRLNAEVLEAQWLEDRARWRVRTADATYLARYLVSAQGPLHEPRIPELPGLGEFAGEVFHSARWNHEVDLAGRSVAVIGTGSSAIQFVPRIQPLVEQLTVFQRTPAWVLPKPDHAVPPVEAAAFRYLPGFQRSYRGAFYALTELLQVAQRSPRAMHRLADIGRRHLERHVADPELRRKLTPSFALGCKRILLSNDYYPALVAPNTSLVASGVERVTARGVVDAAGKEHAADTLIFGTGFRVTDSELPARIAGRGGHTLRDAWGKSPHAYLGTTVHGFPNAFFLLGPNSGNGHGSAFVVIEAQTGYVLSAMRHLERAGLATCEVKADVERQWNVRVDRALENTVWNAGGCSSWYIDETGRNSTIYPWTTIDMRWRMRRFDGDRYVLRRAPAVRDAEPRPAAGTAVYSAAMQRERLRA